MTGPGAPLEVELKLAVAPDALGSMARHPAVRAVARGRARTTRLVTTYHDTADRRLARAGVALRLRRDGRRWLMTVKGNAGSGGTLTSRPEYEWPVAGGAIDTMRLATTPWRTLFAKALAKDGLAPVFSTDFRRTSIPLGFDDGTRATLAIDDGRIVAGARESRIAEIEVEIASGDARRAIDLARTLAQGCPVALEPRSKAARGYALADGLEPAPVRAEDPVLEDGPGARAVADRILDACLRQVEGNAPGLPGAADPEWIHQMRIGARRLRSCLALTARLHDPAASEALRGETRWLLDALGAARDLDVFALDVLPVARAQLAALGVDDKGPTAALGRLAAQVAQRRRAMRAHAFEAVASPRFVSLVLDARRLALLPGPDRAAGDEDARAFASRRLERRARDLDRVGAKLATAGTDERHALRIAAKKLRYATEFFAPLFPRKRSRAYQRALADLQQVLGQYNDAAVAPRLCAGIAGPAAPATAAMAAWSAAGAAALVPAIDRAWRDLRRTPPFWKRTKDV